MIDSHIELFPIIQLTLSSGVRVYLSHRHRHTVKSQIRAKSFFCFVQTHIDYCQ